MTIKEIFQRIINVFRGDKKMLPEKIEAATLGNQSSKEAFVKSLKEEVPEFGKIDMQQDFLEMVEEYNKCAGDERKILDKMFLASHDIEFSDESDVEQLRKEAIEKYAKEKNAPIGLANTLAKMDQENYLEDAFNVFYETKKRTKSGENLSLSGAEKMKVDLIEQLLQTEIDLSELQGKMTGIMHSTYTHSLTNDKNVERKSEIEKNMEETKKIAELFKFKGEQKGLEIDDTTDLDRLLYESAKSQEFLTGLINYKTYESYKKSYVKYEAYLENGGNPPELDVIENAKVSKTAFEMPEEESKKFVDEADRLISEGKINSRNER